ncbi:RsmB/NOP family class I SAM-dependent RNA methyltransferase [Falsigemmobacter faecalis]|uniref:RsmB/NOP family class I SAM-dependent RNA methyltransferase n=1 Tax=Falsigemmobacter faecalis TaxID=2488730 RepID=A0A3P3DEC3_9RHOB|nr:RsmB/NOP family class I SAM-dependent RNA methyltransferase [Falsigemmobacter faecalis]RRH72623.1 RsmB/NOP family class I SAM-dependent RNA methyltransferase [Falsigemmobacter faecalis]
MTPGARTAAAIAVLDRILAGEPAEKALVNWARNSRFAGSGDRSAVRDHVFDALRRIRSASALGGGRWPEATSGRALMLGLIRAQGGDEAALFNGQGHAPAPVTDAETARAPEGLEALDCADWIAPQLREALGAGFDEVMGIMQSRAAVFLRVNLRLSDLEGARRILAAEEIETRPHPLAATALEVISGAKKIARSEAYLNGVVELQDVASQAVVAALDLADGQRVLDFCAGGGGKSLAMAALANLQIDAHDISFARMSDLPARAERARAEITLVETAALSGDYDLVLADAPCSGSGAWRRQPEARWRLDAAGLARLTALQAEVLASAAAHVAPGGRLAYATCSLLEAENGAQIAAFLAANPGYRLLHELRLTPAEGGDGFYMALLQRA